MAMIRASLRQRGFTIIELIIIIVVVAILATIAVVAFSQFQRQARDAERLSDVTVLGEALEKYYEKNGQYPDCSFFSASESSILSSLELTSSILEAPRGENTSYSYNSQVTCVALDPAENDDRYSYLCDNPSPCLEWIIEYRHEQTDSVQSIASRRQAP